MKTDKASHEILDYSIRVNDISTINVNVEYGFRIPSRVDNLSHLQRFTKIFHLNTIIMSD